jgi:hypothetical protein
MLMVLKNTETRNGSGVVDDYLNRALGFAVAIT